MISAAQSARLGPDVDVNVHFHTLAVQGVVETLFLTIARRVARLVKADRPICPKAQGPHRKLRAVTGAIVSRP